MRLEQYLDVRKYTESLCAPLNIEDYIPQAAEFTSPPKWHLAHTTWFFEEMILKKYMPNYSSFSADFGFLFNSYYQTVGERAIRAQRGVITRPTVEQVYQYRQYVDQHIIQFYEQYLPKLSNHNTEDKTTIDALLTLGVNHEQQHQELLLTDLKYTFSINPTHPVYREDFDIMKPQNTDGGWLSIDAGLYSIGHKNTDFCFDNELGLHQVYLHPYQIAKTLVSNREYIEFIENDGYSHFNYWLDEGWTWISDNNINKPLYWQKHHGAWYHYTLAGLKEIELDAAVTHISYYEAYAFASWKNMRLPTEHEWEVASHQLNWGERWEWTASSYQPYPGFRINDGAVGEYNGKFMVNQMVLRGASIMTPQDHSRYTYRNFFHPYLQWQYSGIRLVK